MFCSKCGKKFEGDSVLCPECSGASGNSFVTTPPVVSQPNMSNNTDYNSQFTPVNGVSQPYTSNYNAVNSQFTPVNGVSQPDMSNNTAYNPQFTYNADSNSGYNMSVPQGTMTNTVAVKKPFYKKWWFWLIAVIVGIVILGIAFGGGSSSSSSAFDDPNVKMVKTGCPQGYPNITYGEAFSSFFSSPKWESFTSTDGDTIVEFTGECSYDGSPAEILIQFTLDGSTFSPTYLSINGVSQNRITMVAVINKVFKSY